MHLFDLTYAANLPVREAWDLVHAVATLQGIVNRPSPDLYLRAVTNRYAGNIQLDDYWLNRLRAPGAWLESEKVEVIPDFPSLIALYRSRVNGLVVYDERVPATSNVASTIAGVEDLVAVRYDPAPGSFYTLLTGMGLPVVRRLFNADGSPMFTGKGTIPDTGEPSSNSAKTDAYRWAISRYLDTGLCGTATLACTIDAAWLKNPKASDFWNHTLTNHDYFVSNRAFFFDLSPHDDEPATDDPEQEPGTDAVTLRRLLASVAKQNDGQRLCSIGGFVPWAYKYTDLVGGKYGGVPSEWKLVQIASAYNAFLDADALSLSAMANASFYRHQPLPVYPLEVPRSSSEWHEPEGVSPKRYITFYVGDWDSAAWMYQMLPGLWDDPERGSVPMGWAFNPNLSARFPAAFWYTRATRTENDWFVSGDCGAGYLNPSLLEEPRPSGLPSAVDLWRRHCQAWYQQFGLGITGFVIDGYAPSMSESVLDAYAKISPVGTIEQNPKKVGMHKGMPLIRMSDDLSGSPEDARKAVLNRVREAEPPTFHIFRAILQSPSWYRRLVDGLEAADRDIAVLDPYSFMALYRRHLESVKSETRR